MNPLAFPSLLPAVFLDRDGVLNRAYVRGTVSVPPSSVDELEILPGVASACGRLRDAGFVTVVVTNQPDIARGTTTWEDVKVIHGVLARRIAIDDIATCPHDDADRCSCRKPAPGMLLDAANRLALDLPASVLVGDRWQDIEAGRRAGCRTVLVRPPSSKGPRLGSDHVASDLAAAVEWILSEMVLEGGSNGSI